MIIIDSSVWVALMNPKDISHEKAKEIIAKIHYSEVQIFDHVYGEILTVLRNKFSDSFCGKFVKFFRDTKKKISLTDEEIFSFANYIFFQFKKLSFIDCLILSSAKINKTKIITFDIALQKAWEEIKN